MAHIDELYPSKYLKASDLEGRTVNVVMDRIEIEEVGQKKERRPILYFQHKDKGLVLNKTNAKKISSLYGGNYDDWSGREIALFSMMVEFSGEQVPAIRVGIPAKVKKEWLRGNSDLGRAKEKPVAAPPPRKPAAEYENPAEGMDDEVPF